MKKVEEENRNRVNDMVIQMVNEANKNLEESQKELDEIKKQLDAMKNDDAAQNAELTEKEKAERAAAFAKRVEEYEKAEAAKKAAAAEQNDETAPNDENAQNEAAAKPVD